MKAAIYGDSLLKFVLWEDGRYHTNPEYLQRFSREFGLELRNRSYFGSCADKGHERLTRDLQNGMRCDYAVIEFGGNDCSYPWADISADPEGEHGEALPLPEFLRHIRACIRELRAAEINPILTNTVPFDPKLYLAWVARDLDADAIHTWLGEDNRVYRRSELYSRALEQLSREESVPLVDLRSAFLRLDRLSDYYCADGVHPNRAGQAVIYDAFAAFARSMR